MQCLKGSSSSTAGAEKRRASRMDLQAKVVVAPFSAPGKLGKPLNTLTRDISFTGIGLLNTAEMEKESLLVIRLPRNNKPSLLVLAKVMHCRQLADNLYAIGAEYMEMLETEGNNLLDPKDAKGAKENASEKLPSAKVGAEKALKETEKSRSGEADKEGAKKEEPAEASAGEQAEAPAAEAPAASDTTAPVAPAAAKATADKVLPKPPAKSAVKSSSVAAKK
jgi:hypothetical protein